MNLLERIDAIAKLHGWSARELSRRAGIAEAHLAVLRGRLKKDPDGSGVTLDTIVKLAAAGGVRLEWLAKGEGPMLAADAIVEFDPQRPELSRAVRMFETGYAESFGGVVTRESIGRVDAQFKGMPDMPAEWWLAKLIDVAKTVKAEARGKAEKPAPVLDDLEDEIAAHRAKKPGK